MKLWGSFLILAGLALLRPPAATAQVRYNIQPVVKAGDPVGGLPIPAIWGSFDVAGLDDTGRVWFSTATNEDLDNDPRYALIEEDAGRLTSICEAGGTLGDLTVAAYGGADVNSIGQVLLNFADSSGAGVFGLYSAGELSIIEREGGSAPGGKWAGGGAYMSNQRDDVAFSSQLAGVTVDLPAWVVSAGVPPQLANGVYRWDAGTQQITPVAVKGTRLIGNSLEDGMVASPEAINDRGEIVFAGSSGSWSQTPADHVTGLFLFDRNGSIRPVALIGQPLPGGDTIGEVDTMGGEGQAALDDSGAVTFIARGKSDGDTGLYQWENGVLSDIGAALKPGSNAPGGGNFAEIDSFQINPKDGSLLVAAEVTDNAWGAYGLYRLAAGQVTAVAAPGQTTPDGSIVAGPTTDLDLWEFSRYNDAGQIAFLAQLADGSTAAYLADPDGKLTSLLKDGQTTSLGTITQIGPDIQAITFSLNPVGLNNRGQVALPVGWDSGVGPEGDAVLLLTPQ